MRYIKPKLLKPENYSDSIYIKINQSNLALFKFLLEAHQNLAIFTTLDPKKSIIKLNFSKNDKNELISQLQNIKTCVYFELLENH